MLSNSFVRSWLTWLGIGDTTAVITKGHRSRVEGAESVRIRRYQDCSVFCVRLKPAYRVLFILSATILNCRLNLPALRWLWVILFFQIPLCLTERGELEFISRPPKFRGSRRSRTVLSLVRTEYLPFFQAFFFASPFPTNITCCHYLRKSVLLLSNMAWWNHSDPMIHRDYGRPFTMNWWRRIGVASGTPSVFLTSFKISFIRVFWVSRHAWSGLPLHKGLFGTGKQMMRGSQLLGKFLFISCLNCQKWKQDRHCKATPAMVRIVRTFRRWRLRSAIQKGSVSCIPDGAGCGKIDVTFFRYLAGYRAFLPLPEGFHKIFAGRWRRGHSVIWYDKPASRTALSGFRPIKSDVSVPHTFSGFSRWSYRSWLVFMLCRFCKGDTRYTLMKRIPNVAYCIGFFMFILLDTKIWWILVSHFSS